jgi:Methylamine utilisation protein MauE
MPRKSCGGRVTGTAGEVVIRAMGYLTFGCQVLVGLVFLVAVAGKLRDVGDFARSVPELAPALLRTARPVAWLVIGLELLVVALMVGALLAVPAAAVAGFALALALDGAFTAAIVLALRRRTGATCRCFGPAPRRLGVRHVVRDLVLGLAALLGLAAGLAAGPRGTATGLLLAAVSGAVAAAVVVSFDDIADLIVAPRRNGTMSTMDSGYRPGGRP